MAASPANRRASANSGMALAARRVCAHIFESLHGFLQDSFQVYPSVSNSSAGNGLQHGPACGSATLCSLVHPRTDRYRAHRELRCSLLRSHYSSFSPRLGHLRGKGRAGVPAQLYGSCSRLGRGGRCASRRLPASPAAVTALLRRQADRPVDVAGSQRFGPAGKADRHAVPTCW